MFPETFGDALLIFVLATIGLQAVKCLDLLFKIVKELEKKRLAE